MLFFGVWVFGVVLFVDCFSVACCLSLVVHVLFCSLFAVSCSLFVSRGVMFVCCVMLSVFVV